MTKAVAVVRRFLADLPLNVSEQANSPKKAQTLDSSPGLARPLEEDEGKAKLDSLNRAMSAYAAIVKRLVDLDDVIDIEGVEFDPNVDEIEWKSIRPDSLASPKFQKQVKVTTFADCVAKNKKVYEIVLDQDLIASVVKGRQGSRSYIVLGQHGRARETDTLVTSQSIHEHAFEDS